MAMKLLVDQAWPDDKNPKEFRMVVHFNDTKVQEDGSPDPRYVERFTWGYDPSTDGQKSAYIGRCKAEAKRLCEARLTQVEAMNTPSVEGQAF